jgi:hypothetical protein
MAVLVCSDDRGATSQSCRQQPCGSFEVPARMEWCREARVGGEEYGTHFAFELLNVPNDFLLRQFRVFYKIQIFLFFGTLVFLKKS